MEIHRISVLGQETIHCGFHLKQHIVETLLDACKATSYIFITDEHIAALHLQPLVEALRERAPKGSKVWTFAVPPGEGSKCRETKAKVEDFMLSHKMTRDTVLIALGGGVIGDLAGFVAATYMRGIRFVQIPTTLLAMVDSSVGGKTAIDVPAGKNLIGSFWQPSFVFVDLAFLSTLPRREVCNGMAEVIKTAAIWNENEFNTLVNESQSILATTAFSSDATALSLSRPQELLLQVVTGSISVKARIVTIDERETGLRNLVNFGHTIGHAIEAVTTPHVLHGEAVSIGMILEAECSRSLGILSQVHIGRLSTALKAYSLPTSLQELDKTPNADQLQPLKLLDIMSLDKKNSGALKKVVLLDRIGHTHEQKATGVADDILLRVLHSAIRVEPSSVKSSFILSTPGSKSISNRALLLAALSSTPVIIHNMLYSDDTQVMMAALEELKGATFEFVEDGRSLRVTGNGGSLHPSSDQKHIYLGNAGTAARFMTTCAALIQSPQGVSTVLTGNERMKQRPIGPLVDALVSNGTGITYEQNSGCLPLKIEPGGLRGGRIQLAASVSSQYVSSILLCAPYANEPVVLELIGGHVISQPYIDMTIAMMSQFGISVRRRPDSDIYDIPCGVYRAPPEYYVESDASSATYPLAIAAITGTQCTVQNIGSASMQGDAGFAVKVLRRMGCHVEQSENSTLVKGPPMGTLKSVDTIDFESMTDAFLTGSILFAVASDGPTTITGIANQRVKECNRIQAMCTELAKFGVRTQETDDGLRIFPTEIKNLTADVSVHTYDDHRVAMSFSVLATVAKGVCLEEKRCVEKTWPSWWDDMANKVNVSITGASPVDAHKVIGFPAHSPSSIILLIGMRGSGKTYVGQTAARMLGKQFLDADAIFEQKHGPIKEFVKSSGWTAFRQAELAVLREISNRSETNLIVSLGGGCVELSEARDLIKHHGLSRTGGPVVHIDRDIDDIIKSLDEDNRRPSLGEDLHEVYKRREPWFLSCSTHVYANNVSLDAVCEGMSALTSKHHEKAICRMFQSILGLSDSLPAYGPPERTFFVPTTVQDIRQILPDLSTILIGADAVELRVDLLNRQALSSEEFSRFVGKQICLLRMFSDLPIVFTVRSSNQGGEFPDQGRQTILSLLRWAFRYACEFVDIEGIFSDSEIMALHSVKGHSKIIMSWHDWTGNLKWSSPEMMTLYKRAAKFADIIKLVGTAQSMQDNFALEAFRNSLPAAPSLMALNMGLAGQLSRALNPVFSPITHPLLPCPSAPGQLTLQQIHQCLMLCGGFPAKEFVIIGNPCKLSISPAMHNAAFQALGLPYSYKILEVPSLDPEASDFLKNPRFGGASVTIPYKSEIMKYLSSVSPVASAIGAVNTVICQKSSAGENVLVGENTDWLAIRRLLKDRLRSGIAQQTALVLGAGGTARAAIYCLLQLGCKNIILFNRTLSKAQDLANFFNSTSKIHVTHTLNTAVSHDIDIIISTVPADQTTCDKDANKLHLPRDLFKKANGIVLDASYRPKWTPLLQMAKATRGDAWAIIPGIEMLIEQAIVQNRLFTDRRGLESIIRSAAYSAYDSEAH